jgi:hypothetical protein
MVQRDSGPSGWVDRPGRRYELDGWGIFEAGLDSPRMCRGWFRCTADDFMAPTGAKLSLRLSHADGSARLLTVEITRVKATEPEWHFLANR